MLRIGDVIYGFCRGHFGRDSYSNKRVEAIGSDWVVAREEDGDPVFCCCVPEELEQFKNEQCSG